MKISMPTVKILRNSTLERRHTSDNVFYEFYYVRLTGHPGWHFWNVHQAPCRSRYVRSRYVRTLLSPKGCFLRVVFTRENKKNLPGRIRDCRELGKQSDFAWELSIDLQSSFFRSFEMSLAHFSADPW